MDRFIAIYGWLSEGPGLTCAGASLLPLAATNMEAAIAEAERSGKDYWELTAVVRAVEVHMVVDDEPWAESKRANSGAEISVT